MTLDTDLATNPATDPAGAEPEHAAQPVGTWTERLLLERGTYTSTLRFTENGRALILAGPRPGCVGAGSWDRTGPHSFRFRMAELVFEPDGSYVGWVDIDQVAEQDGDTFTSAGVSHVYDAQDHLLETAEVRAQATRAGEPSAPGADLPTEETHS